MLSTISSNLKISDLLQGDLQLTSPPNIYFEMQKIVEDPNKSITDIGYIIEQDPTLSIRLLKIVNSAFFGLPGQISSIKHAITIIGVRELQNLTLATIIIDKFTALPGGLLSMQDFWARSLRCALISKELCIYRNNKNDLDSMFICGLLHDVGQLVFYRKIPELARQIGLLAESGRADEIQVENSILGFNHYQTGSELARLWGLPEIIVETIGQHAQPDYIGAYAGATSIIKTAHYLCRMDNDNTHLNTFCSNIPLNDLDEILDKVQNRFEAIFNVFYPTPR